MKYGSHLIFGTTWDSTTHARHKYFQDPKLATVVAENIIRCARDVCLIPMAVAVQPDHIHAYVCWDMSRPRDQWRHWQDAMHALQDCAVATVKEYYPELYDQKILSWYQFHEVKEMSYNLRVQDYINRQARWYG